MCNVVRRALVALLIGALVGLMVTGCAEDQAAPSEPIWTTTGTPTPTQSPTPTSAPEKETVEEFLDKWATVSARMQTTGDTKPFEELFRDGCESCERLVESVKQIYSAGGKINAEPWRLISVDQHNRQGHVHTVTFTLEAKPSSVVETSGGAPRDFPGGQETLNAELVRAGQSWTILFYGIRS